MLILCMACDWKWGIGNENRSLACPCEQHCRCNNAMQNLLREGVYQRCKAGNAIADKWHKWITAQTVCLWKANTTLPSRADIIAQLRAYDRAPNSDCLSYTPD